MVWVPGLEGEEVDRVSSKARALDALNVSPEETM